MPSVNMIPFIMEDIVDIMIILGFIKLTKISCFQQIFPTKCP